MHQDGQKKNPLFETRNNYALPKRYMDFVPERIVLSRLELQMGPLVWIQV